MSKSLRIALCQMPCRVGTNDETLDANSSKILEFYNEAAQQNCDIALLPELGICGYAPEDALLRNDVQTKIMDASNMVIQNVLNTKTNTTIVFGSPRIVEPVIKDGKRTYSQNLRSMTTLDLVEKPLANALVVVDPSTKKVNEVYKKYLPNWGIFDEVRWFASAQDVADPIEINSVKVGLLNCRDIWKQDAVEDLVKKGAEIILVPNASPYANTRHSQRVKTVSAYAKMYSVPIAYVNMIEACDEAIFDGGSFAVDFHGNLIEESKRFEETITFVDVEIPEKTNPITSEVIYPDISAMLVEDFDEEETYKAIVLGVREFFNAINKSSEVVIGLSGGVDSSLVATIAVDALGAKRVHGVLLPSMYSSKESTDLALDLANTLGIEARTFSIEKMHETATNEFSLDSFESVVGENVQSRLRGLTLMVLSNAHHWLPIATSNKSEAAVGYFTLYGDSVGAYAPIKDVYKTDVYKLCNWRNSSSEFQVKSPISQAVIDRAPTAELRENQTDETALYPYEILDGVLKRFIDWDMSEEQIIADGFDKDVVTRIVGLVKSAEFKRKQSPVGPRLTRRSFGKDRRIPISYKW